MARLEETEPEKIRGQDSEAARPEPVSGHRPRDLALEAQAARPERVREAGARAQSQAALVTEQVQAPTAREPVLALVPARAPDQATAQALKRV
jgi:hypothetical protein